MCDKRPIEYHDANTGKLLYRSRSQPPKCDCSECRDEASGSTDKLGPNDHSAAKGTNV
jgi:hypothetical protein